MWGILMCEPFFLAEVGSNSKIVDLNYNMDDQIMGDTNRIIATGYN